MNEHKPILNPDGHIIHINVDYYDAQEQRAKELGKPSPWARWGTLGIIPDDHISKHPEEDTTLAVPKSVNPNSLPQRISVLIHELNKVMEIQVNSIRDIVEAEMTYVNGIVSDENKSEIPCGFTLEEANAILAEQGRQPLKHWSKQA